MTEPPRASPSIARDNLGWMSRRSAAVPIRSRTASARVVGGRIVTRARFPDGTKLILQVDTPAPPIELTAEDEVAIDRALASVRAGKGVSLDTVRAILHRL
jgi:hypothetical protein